jgi:hypothetical protein
MGRPFVIPGVNFSGRSPFQLRNGAMPGIAPRSILPPELTGAGSLQSAQGVPLRPYGGTPGSLIRSESPVHAENPPRPVYNPGIYGNAYTVPIVFVGAGEIVPAVMNRPSQTRISLLIQNLSVVGNIFYCFDRTADAVTCIAIGPGGNRLFDVSVPQGDLHIFSSGAGVVIVEYMNQDVSNPAAGE